MIKLALDKTTLLAVGACCAFLAWLFWNSLGPHAFEAFGLIFVVYLLAENYTLKKYIKNNLEKEVLERK